MQKHRRSLNWLVVLLCILLTGLTVWSVSILVRNTQINETANQQESEKLASISNGQTSQDKSNLLMVGGDDSNPPYSYLQNGQALGLDNDLMRAVAKNLGMTIEFHLSPLGNVKQNLQNGIVNVIGGFVNSGQPDQGLLFGSPHAMVSYDLFVRRDSGIRSIADMKVKTIIIQSGEELDAYLSKAGYQGQIVFADNPLEALTWLASGKYDGAIIGKIQGYYLLKNNHISNVKGTGETLDDQIYGFAVAADNRNLMLKINQALGVIEATGAFEQISGEWLSTYQQASFLDKNEYFIYGLVLLFTIILIVLLWGWSLRKLVRRRTSELHTSEKKYRQLINNATEGVAIIVEKNLVYLNPQAAAILGFNDKVPEQKLLFLDFIHPLDHEIVLVKYQQLMDDLQVKAQLSFRLLTVNGVTRWIQSNSVKIEWDNLPAILTFFSDITEEKKLEETIRNSEERYRLIFAQSPVGMFYYDSDLHITNVNDRFAEIMQLNRNMLQDFDLKNIDNPRIIDALNLVMDQKDGLFEGWIKPFMSENQSNLYVKLRTTPMINSQLENQGGIGLLEDITEQIASEHKIQKLEEKFSKVFFTSTDAINIVNLKDGRFIDFNRGFTDLTGYTREELIGKSSTEIGLWVYPEDRDKLLQGLLDKGEYKNLESQFKTKNGEIHSGLMSASLIEVEGNTCILSITRDIDEIKRSDELIRTSELRYRTIFESVPVSIWEQDLLEIYDMFENLRASGIMNLAEYMDDHPDFVNEAVRSVKIVGVNEASLKIYKASRKDQLIISLDRIFNQESIDNFKKELVSIWNHEAFFNGDSVNLDLEGNPIRVNVVMKIPQERDGFRNILVSILDITKRKLVEEALFESESRYRQLIEQINVVVYLDYAGFPTRHKYVSRHIESLLGYSQEEWLNDQELIIKVVHPDDINKLMDALRETDKTGAPFMFEYRAYTRDGCMIWIHDEAVLVFDAAGKPDDWHGIMYDITARKEAEEALRESENRYRTIFDSVPVSIKEEDFSTVFRMLDEVRAAGITDLAEFMAGHPNWVKEAAVSVKINEVNLETLRIYDADSKEQLIKTLNTFFSEESYASFEKELMAFWNHQSIYTQELVNTTLTGEKINVWVSISIPPDVVDYSRILVTVMDITERKRAEEQIRLQVRYLAALRAVDMAISASMDLPITLRVLLNQVHQQLLPDAVAILTLDPRTQTLRYSAGIGFQSNAIEFTNLRLGQSYAGQAALERRIVMADDLATKMTLIHTKDFEKEGFTHYIGIPLVSKGTVKGVLELFNHKPFNQDSAWTNLLESMAGQAAIAIENATLMDEVQKVNINLRSAYDATIEGWAQSIDLRNGDSENHSKRVADLTIELAQTTGFQGEGLLNLRRGALLHDIGKFGVPDSILLKPAPLSDEEWTIMKTYPLVARQLLTSIDFLQSSMEIPYSHHEHWDGSGYPEGLTGTQIPFGARVFAVVDCWDSLRSDRPWRKAWTDDNAWDYIEANSGKLFDPQIVEKFRQLLGHGFASYF